LTPSQLIARAEALRPHLLELQEDTERRGYPSAATHALLERAGIYRTLQPKCFGGYEFDIATFFKVMIELGRGCPSTAWYASLASGHALVLGIHWPAEGQAELFGAKGDFRANHRPGMLGVAMPVEGGYLVSGTWDYCSGIPYASHFLGGVSLPTGETITVAVPRDRFKILDDWGAILGFRGSGSNSVVVNDAFVPAHHTVAANWNDPVRPQETPGYQLHKNPMYLARNQAFYHGELAVSVIGAARAALDEYERIITQRRTRRGAQAIRAETLEFQQYYGLALTLTDSAEALLLRIGDTIMECCRRQAAGGEPFSQGEDVRLFSMAQYAARSAADAVELLFRTASSSAAKDGQRMQRYVRDVLVYRGHFNAQYMETASGVARVHLGLPGGYMGA
jgi:3-hydroxy-9,10-secoandrosta-1,3,5(10)-triene-9,17-dione monooxygenase